MCVQFISVFKLFVKNCNVSSLFLNQPPSLKSTTEAAKESGYGTISDGMVKASHMELLFAYHRVSIKLAAFGESKVLIRPFFNLEKLKYHLCAYSYTFFY